MGNCFNILCILGLSGGLCLAVDVSRPMMVMIMCFDLYFSTFSGYVTNRIRWRMRKLAKVDDSNLKFTFKIEKENKING